MALCLLIISKGRKEETVLNQTNPTEPNKQETDSQTAALALSNPTDIDKNLLEEKAAMETQIYLVLQAGVFKRQ